MRFEALSKDDMRQVLREKLPRADDVELAALIEAGKGSPGRALGYAGLDIAGIDAMLAKLAGTGDPGTALRHELAKSLALKAAQPRYEAFLARAPAFVADQAKQRSGDAIAPAIRIWEEVRSLSESAVRLSLDPAMTVFSLAGMVAGLAGRASSAKA
jgi:DNA polymerase III subunit delta'